jgi:hypothetical protein
MNENSRIIWKPVMLGATVFAAAGSVVAVFFMTEWRAFLIGAVAGLLVLAVNLRLLIYIADRFVQQKGMGVNAMIYIFRLLLYAAAALICLKYSLSALYGFAAAVLGVLPGALLYRIRMREGENS